MTQPAALSVGMTAKPDLRLHNGPDRLTKATRTFAAKPAQIRRGLRARGSVYVLVLGVTAIVGIIGMSALLAVRLEHRGVAGRADAAQAQQLANAALQIVHARLAADPGWRNAHTSGQWSAYENIDGIGRFRFKLADEDDADPSNHEAPVRLTAQAQVGRATRLVSVALQPTADPSNLGPELLTNGDFEAGSGPFFGHPSGTATLESSNDNPRSGGGMLRVKGRSRNTAGPAQNLTAKLTPGKTYRVSAWVRTKDSAATVRLGFVSNMLLLLPRYDTLSAPVSTGWTFVTGDVPFLEFSLLPTYGYWTLHTASGTQELMVDDASVREVLYAAADAEAPGVVRGSYRREVVQH